MKLNRSERTGASERKDCSVGHLTKHKSLDRSAAILPHSPSLQHGGAEDLPGTLLLALGNVLATCFCQKNLKTVRNLN